VDPSYPSLLNQTPSTLNLVTQFSTGRKGRLEGFFKSAEPSAISPAGSGITTVYGVLQADLSRGTLNIGEATAELRPDTDSRTIGRNQAVRNERVIDADLIPIRAIYAGETSANGVEILSGCGCGRSGGGCWRCGAFLDGVSGQAYES
jgi:hypothetical protein